MAHPTRTLKFVTDPDTGRRWPIPEGGDENDRSGDAQDQKDDGDSQDDGSDDSSDSQDPPEPDEATKKAIAAATKKANAEAAKFRKQRDENAAELERLRKQAEGKVDESEVERAAREAAEKATAEWESKMARKEAEAALYRDHGAKFRNPADALAFINLDDLDEDTTLDQAVTELLEARPYLAVDETRPSGSGDAGSRTPPKEKDPGEMSVAEYQEWRRKKIEAGEWSGPNR